MSNILHLQQNLIDIQERINREVQFGEDTARELLKTVGLLKETTAMLEKQIVTVFSDRRDALMATLGQPKDAVMVESDPAPKRRKVIENETQVAAE
jgi:hypothetical protein